MVKGISRQVIVVHAPDPKLFEQAIFILKDEAVGKAGITDEALLKEANRLINMPNQSKKRKLYLHGPVWACGGAVLIAIAWILTAIF